MKIKRLLLIPLFLAFTACAGAAPQFSPAQVAVCFTPNGDCTDDIVQQINAAKQSIYMQAYSFTSGKIAYALIRAFKRGVQVKVVLDKSNFVCTQFSFGSLLIRNGIPVWDDFTPNIAHSKIFIFDHQIVETGSFNFTTAAQKYNAENLVLINSPVIASQFIENWDHRESLSKAIPKDACQQRTYYS